MKSNKLFMIFAAVCAVICLLAGGRYVLLNNGWVADLAKDDAQIAAIRNQIQIKSQAAAQANQVVVQNTTGLDAERVVKDDKAAATFMSKILTWSDYKTYQENRRICIEDYDLDPDGPFMTAFLPDVPEITSADGTTYNRIDEWDLNMRYENMKSYVTNISGSAYSYMAFVTVSARDEKGATSISTCVFVYKVSSGGELYDVSAYTVVEKH